jgi:hypothetical protein
VRQAYVRTGGQCAQGIDQALARLLGKVLPAAVSLLVRPVTKSRRGRYSEKHQNGRV